MIFDNLSPESLKDEPLVEPYFKPSDMAQRTSKVSLCSSRFRKEPCVEHGHAQLLVLSDQTSTKWWGQ